MTNKELVAQCLLMAGAETSIEKQGNGITCHIGRWGYVLGGQGETYTKELAEAWAKAKRSGKGADYFVTSGKPWYTPPQKIVDCSGMIVEAFRKFVYGYTDRTANTFKAQFVRGGLAKTMSDTVGLALWKDGHIGVYVGGGRVVEARGIKYGVVISDLTAQTWTHWGAIKDVVYEHAKPAPAPVPDPKPKTIYTVVKGDTLIGIAKKYGTTYSALAKLNGLKNPSLMSIGQKIKID